MTTTSSSRTWKSASATRKTDISDVSVEPADKNTGYREREIGQTISNAMAKLTDVDWKRETPAITEAFEAMQESMALYAEGKASKMEVKQCYTQFVNAHRRGMF